MVLAIIVGLQIWGIVSAQTTFQEPTGAFPASDVSAPVETGEVAQTKYQTLSFAPVADPTDIRVSVGLSGLRLGNEGSPGFATSWDMVKDFVRVWNGPDASGIISYTGGVKIQREKTVVTPERDTYCGGTPYEVQCYTEDNPYECKGYSDYDEYNDEWEIYPVNNYFSCEWNDCCSDDCDSSCSSYDSEDGDCDECNYIDEFGYYYEYYSYYYRYNIYNGYCYNDITSCYYTEAVPGWSEENACTSRGCTWYPYRAEVTEIVTVPSMEVDSDGNVEIAGDLTVGGKGVPTGLGVVTKWSTCPSNFLPPLPVCDAGTALVDFTLKYLACNKFKGSCAFLQY